MVVSVNSLRPLRPSVLVFDARMPREQALVLDLERVLRTGHTPQPQAGAAAACRAGLPHAASAHLLFLRAP